MLMEIRPVAAPNILVVEIADRIAGRGGRLKQAVLDHPAITENRAAAEASRQRALAQNPEILQKLYPEKFPKR